MPSVYVETTIPSYFAADPSRDLIVAAHQQITHQWWQDARARFDLFISAAVLDEIQAGDPATAARRFELVEDLGILDYTEEVQTLFAECLHRLKMPPRARTESCTSPSLSRTNSIFW